MIVLKWLKKALHFTLFLRETSILVFAKLAIFHSIWIRISFGKIARKITRQKIWHVIHAFWHLPMYITYGKILAHVHDHVHWFYGNFLTLPKVLQMNGLDCTYPTESNMFQLMVINQILLLFYMVNHKVVHFYF